MSGDKTVLESIKELKGWLVILNGPHKGKDFRLFSGKNTVGSSRMSDIFLQGSPLDYLHFSIRFDNSDVWLTDLDSEPGVFLEGTRIWKEKIGDEMIFSASDTNFLLKLA